MKFVVQHGKTICISNDFITAFVTALDMKIGWRVVLSAAPRTTFLVDADSCDLAHSTALKFARTEMTIKENQSGATVQRI